MKLNQAIQLKYSGRDAISLCKKIRKCAVFGRLNVMEEDSSVAISLYVKASQYTFKEFAYRYLRHIQPFGLICIKTGCRTNYLIDTLHKDGFVIKVTDTGDSELDVSFSSYHILVNGIKPMFKCRKNDFCAVIVDKAETLKNREYKVNYTVPYGLVNIEMSGKTIFYKNDVALVRYKDIVESCKRIMQNIYKEISCYSYFTDETYSMVRVKIDNRFKRIVFPARLAAGISPREMASMSIGGMPENHIHFLIDIYPRFKRNSTLCYITGLADAILMEMPNYRIDALRKALKFRFGQDANELCRKIIDGELPSVDVDDFYKINTVYDHGILATELETAEFIRGKKL